jgi:hypothetical protein
MMSPMLIRWTLYMVFGYLAIGTIIYIWGHPRLKRRINANGEQTEETVHRGFLFRQAAHSVQAVNFLFHKAKRKQTEQPSFWELYTSAVKSAFDPSRQQFITTGAPHSRAYYLRNFAWFYPTLLDPATIVSDEDQKNRTTLLQNSLETIIKSMGSAPYTTTLVPLGQTTFAAVNYVTAPSDSLLGIFAGLEQLGDIGRALVEKYKTELAWQTRHLGSRLRLFEFEGKSYLLLDGTDNHSTATDTRRERMRFVVAANTWATLQKAHAFHIISEQELGDILWDRTLQQYKSEIFELFGREGFIKNSLDTESARASGNITLDFVHIHNGIWDFSSAHEIALFKATADIILSDPTFCDASGNCYLVSAENPHGGLLHRMTSAAYHGRTVWPTFNVEFADRLFALADATGDERYRVKARSILSQIESYIEKHGGYPELLDESGELYRTWIYRSAMANSWFPRFVSVKNKLDRASSTTLA